MGNIIPLKRTGGAEPASDYTDDISGLAWAADLPPGYETRADGVWKHGDEETPETWLCSGIAVAGLCSRADGTGWGRVIDMQAPDGERHRLVVDEAVVRGTQGALLKLLYDRGFTHSTSRGADKEVADLLRAWRPSHRCLRVDALGWIDGTFTGFTFRDGSAAGAADVVSSHSIRGAGSHQGDLEGWKAGIGRLCPGNPLALLAVSQALAGPLLKPLGIGGGGFHLVGRSSCGKSTLLAIATSVWGNPAGIATWRATDNAIEVLAADSNDSLLVLDELGQSTPRIASEVVYLLGNGTSKRRMARDGGMGFQQTWSTAILSSGEVSLSDHLASGGLSMHAGQGVRLIDVPADTGAHGAFECLHGLGSGREISGHLRRMAAEHHGVVGEAFVESCLGRLAGDDLRHMKRFLERIVRSEFKSLDLPEDGQTGRVLTRFALAALAGELATKRGLTGWEEGDALAGVSICVDLWAAERNTPSNSEIDELLGQIRAFLAGASLLSAGDRGKPGMDGWIDDHLVYLSAEAWRRLHGDRAEEIARILRDNGALVPESAKSLQRRTPRWVEGRTRAYVIRRAVLNLTRH